MRKKALKSSKTDKIAGVNPMILRFMPLRYPLLQRRIHPRIFSDCFIREVFNLIGWLV